MKMKWTLLLVVCSLLTHIKGFAQVAPQDSLMILKQQTKIQVIETRVSENRLKLQQLEKLVEEKIETMNAAALSSQRSANENLEAANKLRRDPSHKKLSRRAKSAARDAKKEAKQARKAENRKLGLERDIRKLKNKIQDDEQQLEKLRSKTANPMLK